MMSRRLAVLSLYKKILRIGRSWTSVEGTISDSQKEREYILEEARRLFRENKQLSDSSQIDAAIKEAESRVDIALHYKNPWPRPSHIPQHTMLPSVPSRRKKKSDRILHQSKPAYIRSYDIGDKKS